MTGTSPRPPETILGDIRDEAASLGAAVLAAADRGAAARRAGESGCAARACGRRLSPGRYNDMDFVVSKADSPRFRALIEARGYLPDKFFNGLHGATRLYYGAPDGRWSIDIVIDGLNMSHNLDLRGRLNGAAPSVSLADLLLTKLQVFQINSKDLGDTLCLLADHAVSESDSDPEAISLPRLASVLGLRLGLLPHGRGEPGKVPSCGSGSRCRRGARCRRAGPRDPGRDRATRRRPGLEDAQPDRGADPLVRDARGSTALAHSP